MSNATELTKAMAAVERRLKGPRSTAVITQAEFEAISRGLEDLIVFQETTLLQDLEDKSDAALRGETVDLPNNITTHEEFVRWCRSSL